MASETKIGERRCYIFDIDGTLADLSHRLHHIQKQPKDWPSFFGACLDDRPIPHIVELANSLPLPIVCVSGRPDDGRIDTDFWLRVKAGVTPAALYMRKAGDRRNDDIVKTELLEQLRADGWEPVMAFDDRDRVVKAWRANGIP